MNKKEMYYKFIFPDYNSLSGSDSDSTPTSDGVDQTGEVRALCRTCPSRVITYDQLSTDSPIAMYANAWSGTQPCSRSEIKRYVDHWLTIPKYFNLRNYWDKDPPQEGGMSLMVSHTPEVGNAATDWAKFEGDDNKVVYCALMISSGDFFYSYCLPEEVIVKSGLDNEVVIPAQYAGSGNNKTPLLRFHSNWCFNEKEKTAFASALNVQLGQEKRVFVQSYFQNGFQYGAQNSKNTFYYLNFIDLNNNVYNPFDSRLHCVDITGSNTTEFGTPYTGSYKNFPPPECVDHYYINEDIAANRVTRQVYTSKVTNSEAIKVVENASNYNEDLKRDFISLEATRRILYYYDGASLKYNNEIRDIHPTRDIPHIIDGLDKDTVISYEPPDEYLDQDYDFTYNDHSNINSVTVSVRGTPPLQIPYNLLRYTLNDRPPFTDCETVLVMWVANNDPSTISDSAPDKVQQLHDLDWQQYAIPISVRCYYKEPEGNNRNCFERFLVQHPYYQSRLGLNSESPANHSTYNYHYKFNEMYKKNSFQEALFLKDLLDYSQDYVIAYQLSSFIPNNNIFNAQKYLLEKRGSSSCKALYIRKRYVKVNDYLVPRSYRDFVSQAYYIHVPDGLYNINTNKTNYIADASDNTDNTAFVPSIAKDPNDSSKFYFSRERFSKWDYLYDNGWGPVDDEHGNPVEVCAVYDNWFIALIDATGINQDSGKLTLVNNIISGENQLKKFLNDNAPVDYCDWSDIYVSSLGITPYNPFEDDAYLFNKSKNSDNGHTYPIGLLDGYIKIGSTTYGRSHNKVVVGFKKMYDYKYEDLYHFKYYTADNTYKPVKVVYNYSSGNYQTTSVTGGFDCCAYTMNYPNP